jgi:FlaA1/EpsC-like NDP-sugar epimerase
MFYEIDIQNFIKSHVTGRQTSLLQADLEKYHPELSKRINGKNVLVIGGAGSIGSAYIKAILKFRIAKLVVVDIDENGLTELVRDLRSSVDYYLPDTFITYPVNYGDRVFEKLFFHHGPFEIVANFAAHKHVRSEKDIFSIEAMIQNNVLRAKGLLDMMLKAPPEHFFCVSTDKAANPVNIMGASKKLMEDLILAYADKLKISTARFANVAFSNGSLPLGFIERMRKQQPLACPIDIRRYFVSPQESGELCLIASILGESGDIFFPKLDEERDMIPFDQIANNFLKSIGMETDSCSSEEEAKQKAAKLNGTPGKYPVYFFKSDTSGEKSFEEFYTENEQPDMDTFIQLGVVKKGSSGKSEEINEVFNKFNALFSSNEISKADIVELLKESQPDFDHIETSKGLDSKM